MDSLFFDLAILGSVVTILGPIVSIFFRGNKTLYSTSQRSVLQNFLKFSPLLTVVGASSLVFLLYSARQYEEQRIRNAYDELRNSQVTYDYTGQKDDFDNLIMRLKDDQVSIARLQASIKTRERVLGHSPAADSLEILRRMIAWQLGHLDLVNSSKRNSKKNP